MTTEHEPKVEVKRHCYPTNASRYFSVSYGFHQLRDGLHSKRMISLIL